MCGYTYGYSRSRLQIAAFGGVRPHFVRPGLTSPPQHCGPDFLLEVFPTAFDWYSFEGKIQLVSFRLANTDSEKGIKCPSGGNKQDACLRRFECVCEKPLPL
ncbi:hypothetical protein MRX96_004257 [Rhipicephalus microplus]